MATPANILLAADERGWTQIKKEKIEKEQKKQP
jgi:hypothetical protein